MGGAAGLNGGIPWHPCQAGNRALPMDTADTNQSAYLTMSRDVMRAYRLSGNKGVSTADRAYTKVLEDCWSPVP